MNASAKRILLALAALAYSASSNAVLITFDSHLDSEGVSTTNVAGATVVDFESLLGDYDSYSGEGAIVMYSSPGMYAAPYISDTGMADDTHYLSVPYDTSSGSIDLMLGDTANYFGLLWGSIDDYNTISFLRDGAVVESFTGSDITNPANGDQVAPSTNTYVNFFDLTLFDTVRLTSTNYAFESDNHAWATFLGPEGTGGILSVPEPGTLVLLGTGLLGLGLGRRRRVA